MRFLPFGTCHFLRIVLYMHASRIIEVDNRLTDKCFV